MSWKESKVRLLPPLPPQGALGGNGHSGLQDRKPDIQDLFLLANQATALRNTPLSSNSEYVPGTTATTTVTAGSGPVPVNPGNSGPTHLQQPTGSIMYPNVKIEPVIKPSSSPSPRGLLPGVVNPVTSGSSLGGPLDSAMMPPPPPPPPRPPASPGVSSTSDSDTGCYTSSDNNTAHYSPITPNSGNPTASNCQPNGALLGKKPNFL